jgi:hypothetical protein
MKDTQSKEHIENINKYLILAPLSPGWARSIFSVVFKLVCPGWQVVFQLVCPEWQVFIEVLQDQFFIAPRYF